jgi:hypothetical protein
MLPLVTTTDDAPGLTSGSIRGAHAVAIAASIVSPSSRNPIKAT